MLTCVPHPSYPGHCMCINEMSDSLGGDKTARYLDSHVDRLIVVGKNCAIPVRKKVELPGKRKLCWDVFPIDHRKHDDLPRPTALDHGSLAVGTLRNEGTRGRSLLGDCQLRKEHHHMLTAYDPRDLPGESSDVVTQAFVNCVCHRWVYCCK